MRYNLVYDAALKQLATSGSRLSRLMLINVVVWPFVVGLVLISAIFNAFGWNGAIGWSARIEISLALLAGLFYSGFKFVYYSSRVDGE